MTLDLSSWSSDPPLLVLTYLNQVLTLLIWFWPFEVVWKGSALGIVVHSKADKNEDVTLELSEGLFTVTVFANKSNELWAGWTKRIYKNLKETNEAKSWKTTNIKTKEPTGKSIMIRLNPSKF